MWTYLVVFIKIIFTQFSYFSSTYNFTMSSVHDPIPISSPLIFGINLAFCDLGLNANLHLFLICAIIFIIYARWFIAAGCLIIGIASKKARKIGEDVFLCSHRRPGRNYRNAIIMHRTQPSPLQGGGMPPPPKWQLPQCNQSLPCVKGGGTAQAVTEGLFTAVRFFSSVRHLADNPSVSFADSSLYTREPRVLPHQNN